MLDFLGAIGEFVSFVPTFIVTGVRSLFGKQQTDESDSPFDSATNRVAAIVGLGTIATLLFVPLWFLLRFFTSWLLS